MVFLAFLTCFSTELLCLLNGRTSDTIQPHWSTFRIPCVSLHITLMSFLHVVGAAWCSARFSSSFYRFLAQAAITHLFLAGQGYTCEKRCSALNSTSQSRCQSCASIALSGPVGMRQINGGQDSRLHFVANTWKVTSLLKLYTLTKWRNTFFSLVL